MPISKDTQLYFAFNSNEICSLLCTLKGQLYLATHEVFSNLATAYCLHRQDVNCIQLCLGAQVTLYLPSRWFICHNHSRQADIKEFTKRGMVVISFPYTYQKALSLALSPEILIGQSKATPSLTPLRHKHWLSWYHSVKTSWKYFSNFWILRATYFSFTKKICLIYLSPFILLLVYWTTLNGAFYQKKKKPLEFFQILI